MLNQSCENLAGVGTALAQKLERCGIKNLADLVFHLPFRYQDRTHVTAIRDLRPQDYAVVVGKVCKTEVKPGKKMMLYCYVDDQTGILRLRFFHFNKQQIKNMQSSQTIKLFGEVRDFANQLEMIHPEYRCFTEGQEIEVEEALTPIYSTTEGLTQSRLRQLIQIALHKCEYDLRQSEWMSTEELQKQNFMSLFDSLVLLHSPPPQTSLVALEEGQHPAILRLAFEELLAQRLSMQFARLHRAKLRAISYPKAPTLQQQFCLQLPFALTAAQEKVVAEIANDLDDTKPMLRLVQGDVGCGKTTVAALAALQVIAQGYQVALMAPTDLLTEQHTQNLQRWLSPLNIKCARLSSKMKIKERRQILEQLLTKEIQLLVGTHALFQEHVNFPALGLIIIDEQHRFGVEQRLLLSQKAQEGVTPHQLLMTATPIPRTLAMTQFAHLDISIIDELPPGRIPVSTAVINQEKRELIIARLQTAIAEGKQAYWVCTLIEESEKLQCMAASVSAENLQMLLPEARVGLVHGRLKINEKEETMLKFKRGEIDLLVATTVIEVGVDVPNASLMIIENAERLGLSQLHQLRGRVGRGDKESFCLLLYQHPLSHQGAERLRIMKNSNDGFIIAEKDLHLRGAGEFLGTKQTGYRSLKIANLVRDKHLLERVAVIAKKLGQQSPALAKQIAKQWLGDFEQFIQG